MVNYIWILVLYYSSFLLVFMDIFMLESIWYIKLSRRWKVRYIELVGVVIGLLERGIFFLGVKVDGFGVELVGVKDVGVGFGENELGVGIGVGESVGDGIGMDINNGYSILGFSLILRIIKLL